GMDRGALYALAIGRGVVTGVVAAALTVVVAILVSPFMPIGIARTAELHPGLEVNVLACTVGALAVVGIVVALRAVAAWRVARATARALGGRRTPFVVRLLDRVALPPTADTGARFALDPGRGATAVPV